MMNIATQGETIQSEVVYNSETKSGQASDRATEGAHSHTSVFKTRWLIKAYAPLPAGASCLSHLLTAGKHMYINFSQP